MIGFDRSAFAAIPTYRDRQSKCESCRSSIHAKVFRSFYQKFESDKHASYLSYHYEGES